MAPREKAATIGQKLVRLTDSAGGTWSRCRICASASGSASRMASTMKPRAAAVTASPISTV